MTITTLLWELLCWMIMIWWWWW